MNRMVMIIAEIIKTTAQVYRMQISDNEVNELAVNCWLQSGGDRTKILDYLEDAMRPYDKR